MWRGCNSLFFAKSMASASMIAHQRAALIAVDDVGFEHREPAFQAVPQRITPLTGGQRLQTRQMMRVAFSLVGSEMKSLQTFSARAKPA